MLPSYPRISIVTPSFNQGAFLEATILSILGQGYPNLEYIIIDGGSTDNSVEIISKYSDQLAHWVSEKDEGLYDGLQKGFSKATGEIMAWINSDDMHHGRSLFVIAELFNFFPEVNWIMGRNSYFDEEGRIFINDSDIFQERWSKWRMYSYDGQFIQQESIFWTRKLWEKSGAYIDRSLSYAGDADLWLRFFRHEQLYSTNFLLSGFRIRTGNQKSQDHLAEYFEEYHALIEGEKQSKGIRRYLLFAGLVKLLSKLIPVRKIRNMIVFKTLEIPPKIVYTPGKGYAMVRKYK